MNPEGDYHLDLNSDLFRFFCERLNSTVRDDAATWSVDILAGAFRFSDEIPADLATSETPEIILPLTTLMRQLWAYRVSLIEGRPRSEFVAIWELTRALAPKWVGFSPDRCSSEMQPIVDSVWIADRKFAEDMERLEAEFSENRKRKKLEESQKNKHIQ